MAKTTMGSEATPAGWDESDRLWDNSHLHEKFRPLLDRLSPGSKVAVITMTGSCCPLTLGHCMAFEVARNLLKERQEGAAAAYSEILGALCLNSDGHVARKLEEKGEKIIDWTSRAMLVRLATAETPWLSVSHLKENWVLWDLRQSWESIHFVQYYLNGADDVLKYEKWTWAVDEDSHFITLGRPTYTERLRKVAPETPLFLIGPELPDISSSQVRAALYEEDYEALKKLLHPAVASWCLSHSPYSPYHKNEERELAELNRFVMDAWDGLLDEQALIAQRKRRFAEQSKDFSDDEDEEKQRQEKANRECKLAELKKKRQLDEIYARKLREQPTHPEHQAWLPQFDKPEIEAILKRSQEQGRHSAPHAQWQSLEAEDSESEGPLEPGSMSVEVVDSDDGNRLLLAESFGFPSLEAAQAAPIPSIEPDRVAKEATQRSVPAKRHRYKLEI
eukprot:Skav225851  [mRNA]  locus=scaffold345:206053:207396:+ [translate_table: standard]